MYKIKAKKGYNVIIEDLGLVLRSQSEGIDVDKKAFDNSEDAKKALKFIEISESEDVVNKEINKVDDKILQVGDNSFVVRPAFEENPEDVFVAKPAGVDQVIEQKTEVKEIVEETKLDTVEIKEEVAKEVKEEIVKETKKEVAKEIKKETIGEVKKEVKVVKDKKPVAKKNAKK